MSVLLETSLGDIVMDLLVDYAPKESENFLKLCKSKYYNFSPVHSVQPNFSFQTGDPLGPTAPDSDGGSSIWGLLSGPSKRTFPATFHPKLKHAERGTVSMATVPNPADPEMRLAGSQFIVTLGDELDYLDGKAAIFGKVVEGFDVLEKINGAITDKDGHPLVDIRIKHTVILDDPFPDPPGLREPSSSPVPSKAQLATVRIAADADMTTEVDEQATEKKRREQEARAQALTLEMMGDLPFAEVKPPENVLFVCKLNPVTTDDDLELIFSRFGKILSCEVIRDKRTGDSLQYAFIEYEDKQGSEAAYFKMQGVLIDDRRIHVDFSQSVSKLSDVWRSGENAKRKKRTAGGGWGGVRGLEKWRKYREGDNERDEERERGRYGMVYSEDELKERMERQAEERRQRGDDEEKPGDDAVPTGRRERDDRGANRGDRRGGRRDWEGEPRRRPSRSRSPPPKRDGYRERGGDRWGRDHGDRSRRDGPRDYDDRDRRDRRGHDRDRDHNRDRDGGRGSDDYRRR
jgi:peptidyl-prolyl cis-trans isomerase-like 4